MNVECDRGLGETVRAMSSKQRNGVPHNELIHARKRGDRINHPCGGGSFVRRRNIFNI